ncbi:MAG TPA: DUF4136 domain-containing protein [Polyangia bacterium]|nr:DUF4136 domain-containing protein [Polyangia bacterium]
MHRLFISLLALAVATSACATLKIATDFDHAANFSQYRTFKLVGGTLLVNGVPDKGNTLVKRRIEDALRAALIAKGLTETLGRPDLLVGYHAGARSRTEIETMPTYGPNLGPYWYGGWWGPGFQDWWTRTYEEGTLVIDLVDASRHALVWRAYASTEVNPPVSEQKIREAVDKAFEHYPPSTVPVAAPA